MHNPFRGATGLVLAGLLGGAPALGAKPPEDGPLLDVTINVPRGAQAQVQRDRQDPTDVLVIRLERQQNGLIAVHLFNVDERDVRLRIEPNAVDSAACGITFDDRRTTRDSRVRLRWGLACPSYPEAPVYNGEETFPPTSRWSSGRVGPDSVEQGRSRCKSQCYEVGNLPFFYAGAVPDGDRVPGSPLEIEKSPSGALVLKWGPSCRESDADYEIYDGVLGGAFEAHAPVLCSTAGDTTATIAAASGSRYYLVVPRNERREGSYGARSDGAERKPGPAPCLPQKTERCR